MILYAIYRDSHLSFTPFQVLWFGREIKSFKVSQNLFCFSSHTLSLFNILLFGWIHLRRWMSSLFRHRMSRDVRLDRKVNFKWCFLGRKGSLRHFPQISSNRYRFTSLTHLELPYLVCQKNNPVMYFFSEINIFSEFNCSREWGIARYLPSSHCGRLCRIDFTSQTHSSCDFRSYQSGCPQTRWSIFFILFASFSFSCRYFLDSIQFNLIFSILL